MVATPTDQVLGDRQAHADAVVHVVVLEQALPPRGIDASEGLHMVEDGISVLVIEQNARIALENSDYGYVLETGKVAIEGPSAELRENEHVQEFYLGGAGDAKEAYEAVVARDRREPK